MRRLVATILLAGIPTAFAQVPEQVAIASSYLQAAVRNEALQATECGRFMLDGNRLSYAQAVSEATAKMAPEHRVTFAKVLGTPTTTKMVEDTKAVTRLNVASLSARFTPDFACGYLIGQLYAESEQSITRFREMK